MKVTGSKGATQQHNGTIDGVERAVYALPSDQREGAAIEVSSELMAEFEQHPRADPVTKRFMGASLVAA